MGIFISSLTLSTEDCNVQYVWTNIIYKIPIQTRALCTVCMIRVWNQTKTAIACWLESYFWKKSKLWILAEEELSLYHLLKSWNLCFTLLCSSLPDVMPLVLPLCNCQLSNKILIGFTAVMKNTAKLPWSRSNALPYTYPQGAASRSTFDGQRGGSPIPQIKPGAERGEQRPDCDEGQEVLGKRLFPSARIWKEKGKKANPKLQNLHSNLSPQQSSNSFERKVPCPVHPFLASNSLALLQDLTSLQGTALPGYRFSSFPDQ